MRGYETMRRKQDSNAEMTFFWTRVMNGRGGVVKDRVTCMQKREEWRERRDDRMTDQETEVAVGGLYSLCLRITS